MSVLPLSPLSLKVPPVLTENGLNLHKIQEKWESFPDLKKECVKHMISFII